LQGKQKEYFVANFPFKKKIALKNQNFQHQKLLFEIVLTFIFGLHAAMHYDQLIN